MGYRIAAAAVGGGLVLAAGGGSPYCVPFGGDETALTQVDEVGTWFGAAHAVYTAEPVADGVPLRVLAPSR